MHNNILVAIQPTHAEKHEQALKLAMQLADDNNSGVTAITVVEPMPSHYVATDESRQKGVATGARAMAELRNFVGPLSEIKTVIQHGAAAANILDYAIEKHIDCIVIASHKPRLRDYFLGATAARVVRHAPCSVHIIRVISEMDAYFGPFLPLNPSRTCCGAVRRTCRSLRAQVSSCSSTSKVEQSHPTPA